MLPCRIPIGKISENRNSLSGQLLFEKNCTGGDLYQGIDFSRAAAGFSLRQERRRNHSDLPKAGAQLLILERSAFKDGYANSKRS